MKIDQNKKRDCAVRLQGKLMEMHFLWLICLLAAIGCGRSESPPAEVGPPPGYVPQAELDALHAEKERQTKELHQLRAANARGQQELESVLFELRTKNARLAELEQVATHRYRLAARIQKTGKLHVREDAVVETKRIAWNDLRLRLVSDENGYREYSVKIDVENIDVADLECRVGIQFLDVDDFLVVERNVEAKIPRSEIRTVDDLILLGPEEVEQAVQTRVHLPPQ